MVESLVLTITGPARTGKSSVAAVIAEKQNIPIVRHSAFIEMYAAEHGIPLSRGNRATFDTAYHALDHEDPHHLTDPVFELTLTHPLVIIDGLRVYRDAKLFKDALGDQYRTATLTAPDPVRNMRDNGIRAKEGKPPLPLEEFLAAEQANYDADYGILDVFGMHDISQRPIDTSAFANPRSAAAQLAIYLRPYISL